MLVKQVTKLASNLFWQESFPVSQFFPEFSPEILKTKRFVNFIRTSMSTPDPRPNYNPYGYGANTNQPQGFNNPNPGLASSQIYGNNPQNVVPDPNYFAQNPAANQYQQAPQFSPQPPAPNPYASQTIYTTSKPKGGLTGIIVAIIVILVLAAGGVGAYLFIDYTNKQETAKKVNAVLDTNHTTYTTVVDKSVEKLKKLEKSNHALPGSYGSVKEATRSLKDLQQRLSDEVEQLETLAADHSRAVSELQAGPNADTQAYKEKLTTELESSRKKLHSITQAHKSLSCINDKNLAFIDLAEKMYKISIEMESKANSSNVEMVIKQLNDLSNLVTKYIGVIEEAKSCFADTGGIFDAKAAEEDLTKAAKACATLRDAYNDLKVALQEKNTAKLNAAEKKLAAIKDLDIRFEEDYYGVFDKQVTKKFSEYYDAVKTSKDTVKNAQAELRKKYEIKGDFFSSVRIRI